MKTKKSRILLSAVSVLLVFSLLIGGTMAWFTDTEKVNANFTAGILDISVKPGETGKTNLDFENERPMLYDNFYKELEDNGDKIWDNNVEANSMDDSYYKTVPAYFKPVDIKNEGTLPTKVQLSLEDNAANGFEPILTDSSAVTIKQENKFQPCANRLKPVLKVFVYKLEGGKWTLVKDTNLNNGYSEDAANPDKVESENTAKEKNNTYTTALLPAGESARYVIAGYLPETVGNIYQGQHYHSRLVLNAYQLDDTENGGKPDEGGSSSEEPVDPFEDNLTIVFEDDGRRVGEEMKASLAEGTHTISNAGYEEPEGYVYNPGEQSTAVTVNADTGIVTPGTVIFTVERTEKVVTVKYNNTKGTADTSDDELLEKTATVALKEPGAYYIAAANAAAQAEKTRVAVPAIPEDGYTFDPDTQAYDVTVGVKDVTPTEVTFNVKPEEPVADTLTIKFYDRINEVDVPGYTVDVSETTTFTKDNIAVPASYYVDPDTQSKTVTVTNGVITNPVNKTITFDVVKKSADGQVIVNTKEGIDNIRENLAGSYVIENDIDMASQQFTPIGWTDGADQTFTGTIDGAGHKLSNFLCDYSSGSATNVGLVAINGGTIKGLSIDTVTYEDNQNYYGVYGDSNVGVVAGKNNSGATISDCHVYGSVGALETNDSSKGAGGGITGSNSGTVYRCSMNGGLEGYHWIGGLVGKNFGTVEQSWFVGNINSVVSGNQAYQYNIQNIGGIAGGNTGTIQDSYVILDDYLKGYAAVGGMVGWVNGGTLNNIYVANSTYVYGNQHTGTDVGYIITTPAHANLYPSISASSSLPSGFSSSIWNMSGTSYSRYPNLVNNAR